jgi:hypothetical protein
MSPSNLSNTEVAARIHKALAPLQIVPMNEELSSEPSIAGLRRYRKTRFEDTVGVITLLDIDGVLIWEDGAVNSSTSTTRRRRGGTAADADVVTQLKYSKELGVNQVSEKLQKLDRSLTPEGPSKLIEYDRKHWTPVMDASGSPADAVPVANGRILLLVHGTFSNTGSMIYEMRGKDDDPLPGRKFLNKAAAKYKQVLGYDHFTLSRTPVVNAVELARKFAGSQAEIDIVCHSRGGLVTRWFCEMLDRLPQRKRRVVFVGCPLRGTSLADPQSLRNGLNLLTNVGKLLGDTCQLIPLLSAAGGLMQILSSAGSFAAKTPLVDAGVGLIPGIAAMSRVANNPELDALNFGPAKSRSDYFAVVGNFQAEEAGWKFWRMFTKLKAADYAADYLVFEQDNDLVVDTESMTHHAFGPTPAYQTDTKLFRYFDASKRVHHTTYFRDQHTVDFLIQSFDL